jgi:penicillin-binding protein 2
MASRVALKDTRRELRIYSARSFAALLSVVALLALLLARYYTLQIRTTKLTEPPRSAIGYS